MTTVASKVLFGPFGRGGHVEGFVAAGWEPVRAAFEANFAEDLELSSQLCTYHEEEVVVNCGAQTRQRSIKEETNLLGASLKMMMFERWQRTFFRDERRPLCKETVMPL